MSNEYDDLDDLLDDDELKKSIIGDAPGAGVKSSTTNTSNEPTESSGESSATVNKDTASEGLKNDISGKKSEVESGITLDDLLRDLDLKEDEISELHKAFPGAWNPKDGEKTANKASNAAPNATSNPNAESTSTTGASFQDTISETANRMKNNKRSARNGPEDQFDESKIMEQLLADLSNEGGDSGMFDSLLGEGEDVDGMISSLLSVLATKEVLYEPMRELNEKFPPWLEANSSKLSSTDLARHTKQQSIARSVVAKFEDPGYSDSDEASSAYIREKMSEMQETGSVPTELVGAEGDLMPELPNNCPTQ